MFSLTSINKLFTSIPPLATTYVLSSLFSNIIESRIEEIKRCSMPKLCLSITDSPLFTKQESQLVKHRC